MTELVQAVKTRYIGLSEASAESLEKAYHTHPISVLQPEFYFKVVGERY
jgi:aryl-alcohol dehydrogenase-like predicted oxidoreductase